MVEMYNFEADELDEADELFGEADEADEAARRPSRRSRPPIRTPQRGNNVPSRPPEGFATKAELTATASRLDTKIGTLSTGVKALDGRIRSLDGDQARLRADLRKETAARTNLQGQISSLQQVSMLMPLLTTPSTVDVQDTAGNTVKAFVDSGDSLSRVLPILLMSGALGGGQPGQSGAMPGTDMNTAMLMAMVVALK